MCKMKSAIILKDRVFVPDYDSHTDMLTELGIEDTRENAEKLFVRAELSPKNGDVFSDIDTWEFNVDQDIIPEWFVKDYEKERMVSAVKEWAKSRIHIGVDGLRITEGKNHYIKDCKNVNIYGNAKVEYICGNATVENIYGNAKVEYICGNAKVGDIYGNAKVEYIRGNATVENIRGNATVENIRGNATVENIRGNATVENIRGNATVEYISDNATVENIRGNATVEYISDNATVEYIRDNATVKKAEGQSVIITSPHSRWNNKNKLILLENSTLKDCFEKVIYQSGDYKLVAVGEDGKIEVKDDE